MSRFSIMVVALAVIGIVRGLENEPRKAGVTVSLACTRQAVGASEAFPVKLTVANDTPSFTFDRTDLISPKSLVAATYERKGKWVTINNPPDHGMIELRAGESYTIEVRITLPEALTKTPTALSLQWTGSGALEKLRSNEVTISIRADQNPTAMLETSEGTIVLECWPDKAPNHVANFLTLAKEGFYDHRLFHRVIPNFMIQTGCPLGTGMGDPGYKIAAELTDAGFVKGTLGMARSEDMDSAGSQFFICVADYHTLDKKYTAFGRVIEGQDVADKISMAPADTQKGNRPYKDVLLKKVTVTMPLSYTLPEVKKVGMGGSATKPESRAETR